MKRLFGQLAFVGRMQIEELAAGMPHATDFSDALLKACFVAGEIVAHLACRSTGQGSCVHVRPHGSG